METLSQRFRAAGVTLGLIASIVGSSALLAQSTGSVRGTVTDSANRAPVPAAHVIVVGTRLGTDTDNDGNYLIRGVPTGQNTIRFARLGYAPQVKIVTVASGSEVVANFSPVRSAVQLEQVVTTVTGMQRTIELGNTVSLVKADSVARSVPVYNVSDMLTSRVPGAMVSAGNGLTGNVTRIRIRGLHSFTVSNDPLVIVDGARIEATSGTASRLGDLSMTEIESMDVVKGPAAATLYGTDAANGVIVIRTKRGQPGRARWTAFGESGSLVESTKDFPDNHYGWGRLKSTNAVTNCLLSGILLGTCVQDSVTTFQPLRDPQLTSIAPGHRGQAGVQVSGGVAQFRYFVSGGWEEELGWMKMPLQEQARLKAERGVSVIPDEQIRPNLLNKINLRGNFSTDIGTKGDIAMSNGVILQSFRNTSTEAFRAGYWGTGSKSINNGYGFSSRIGDNLSVRAAQALTRYISSISANLRPNNWLSARSTLGFDFSNNIIDNLQRNGEGPLGTNRAGIRSQADNAVAQYSFDIGATATTQVPGIANLSSRTSIGAQYNRRALTATTVTGIGLPPGSEVITGAATFTASESHGLNVVLGSFLEQQFGWHDRLFVTAAVRADGASTFGKDLHTTAYPKLMFSWLLSQENFFPKIPGIQSLRLRSAYGSSGVQPGSTAAISTVALSTSIVNGAQVSAVSRGATGNPGVRPERSTELEGGVDIEGLNGRARFEFTAYRRKSEDALVAAPFAASVGGGTRFANIGSVQNNGVEGTLDLRILDRDKVGLDVNLNGSVNTNKLVSVGPDAPPGYYYTSGFVGARHKVGYPLYGGWQVPIIKYADTNGDGILAASEIQMADSEVYLGPTSPTKQVTLTTTLALWRDLVRLTALLDWRGGYVRNDYTRWVGCAISFDCASATVVGSSLVDQAAVIAYTKANSNVGYWADGAYTRLREVAVSVRIPRKVLRYAVADAGSLIFAGRNLLYWSKWSGGDPEVGGGSDLEYTFPTPPLPRVFILRVNLSY